MKNTSAEKIERGCDDVWTTAIDTDTELIVSYTLGQRGAVSEQEFTKKLPRGYTNRFQLTTDGHRVYTDATEDAFGTDIVGLTGSCLDAGRTLWSNLVFPRANIEIPAARAGPRGAPERQSR